MCFFGEHILSVGKVFGVCYKDYRKHCINSVNELFGFIILY